MLYVFNDSGPCVPFAINECVCRRDREGGREVEREISVCKNANESVAFDCIAFSLRASMFTQREWMSALHY